MPPVPPDQQSLYGGERPDTGTKYLTGPQVRARYNVSSMCLWRWLGDPKLAFPQPALRINRRRYWREDDLIRWERSSAPARHRVST
jgi:hypothetical protein